MERTKRALAATLLSVAVLLLASPVQAQTIYPPSGGGTTATIQSYQIIEDFFGIVATPAGAIDWAVLNATVSSGTTPISNHPGIMIITTNSTTAVTGLYSGAVNGSFGMLYSDFDAATFIVAFGTAANVPIQRVGMMNVVGAAPTANSVFFEHLDSDANWFACTQNAAGTVTRSDTNVAYSGGTYVNFRIEHPASTSYAFYIDGVLVATNTLTLPTESVGSYFVFQTDATGTAAAMTVDLFALTVRTSSR